MIRKTIAFMVQRKEFITRKKTLPRKKNDDILCILCNNVADQVCKGKRLKFFENLGEVVRSGYGNTGVIHCITCGNAWDMGHVGQRDK